MTIKRSGLLAPDHYAVVPNAWMRDVRLSRRARGLLAEMLTHRVGWQVTVESLVEGGPEGRDAVRGAIAELERHGYLVREQSRDGRGRLAGTDYVLADPPSSGNPTTDEPTSAGRPPKKTTSSEDQTSEEHSPTAAPRAEVALADPTAQNLLAAFIDWRTSQGKGRLAGQTTKALAASIKRLLADGFSVDHIKRGLAAVDQQGLSPAALARQVEFARDGVRQQGANASRVSGVATGTQRAREAGEALERLLAKQDAQVALEG